MTLSPAGRRQKGKRFERDIAALYRSTGLDETAQSMPMSGAMEHHKGDILKKHDHEWVDECKNQESVKLWAWWQQAVDQVKGMQKPVLHIKRNHTESLSVIRTTDYFDMRLELKQLREQLNIA